MDIAIKILALIGMAAATAVILVIGVAIFRDEFLERKFQRGSLTSKHIEAALRRKN